MKKGKGCVVLSELKDHAPLTLGISLLAGILVAVLYSLGKIPSEGLFEFLHPAHILVSGAATSAIYWRYNKKWINAVLVGVFGAILIGTLSDVLLPWMAGNLFSLHTYFHLPIFEETFLILGAALFGALVGVYRDFFDLSHSFHVFLSVFASLFYLLAFSVELSFVGIVLISGLVFFCVYIPCCVSDIVFPILFVKKPCGKFR